MAVGFELVKVVFDDKLPSVYFCWLRSGCMVDGLVFHSWLQLVLIERKGASC
jgi:hypothetical protein